MNFTGYACTNCHWMKANMFTRPEIAAAMKNFVLVELYTDGTDAATEANQQVQLAKFKTVAIPYYAILDPDENVLAQLPRLHQRRRRISRFSEQARAAPRRPRRSAPAPVAAASSYAAGVQTGRRRRSTPPPSPARWWW